ncbi:FtsX-like permease family protein [Homoserinibacter sp. YIM 151385]|uniref:FtsX-like permease family protein n=1 Tax=Homoserinibacter sp. YIM 151385 TaxID=2985506 RepID=UPI0022F093A1|nr:FtsX-like permease family protein [Homoserinibacter sp. YIM 151385]WBU39013.1 hypothetical protein OF852_05380 [Homoserinibacter sp. YIM 151385]
MSARSRSGTVGLLLRLLADRPGATLLLAALIALLSLGGALAPRLMAGLGDAELAAELDAASPLRSGVTGVSAFGYPSAGGEAPSEETLFGEVRDGIEETASTLERPLGPALEAPDWTVRVPPIAALPKGDSGTGALLTLLVDLEAPERTSVLEGRMPEPWSGDAEDETPADARPPLEIALGAEAAERVGARVGSRFDSPVAPLLVVGVLEAADPGDPHWIRFPQLLAADEPSAASGRTVPGADALIAPATAAGLGAEFQNAELRIWFPVEGRDLAFADADALLSQLRQLGAAGRPLPAGQYLDIQTGLDVLVLGARDRLETAAALLALLTAVPMGAALAVLALGAHAVARGRAPTAELLRARGAGALRPAAVQLIALLVAVVPATALGVGAAAVLSREDPGPVGAVLPALLAAAVLATALVPVRASDRARVSPERSTRGRWLRRLELAVAAAAALAIALLLRRGYADGGGPDPLLAAAPLLVALAIGILVLRLLPLASRLALALARGRTARGPVLLIGAAGAAHGGGGLATALPVLLGVSAAVASLCLSATLTGGLERAAVEETGADVRLSATVDAELEEAVAAVEGVRAVAPLAVAGGVEIADARSEVRVQVAVVSFSALRVLRPELGIPETGPGRSALMLSPALAERFRDPELRVDGTAVPVAGVARSTLPGVARSWALLDADAAVELRGTPVVAEELLIGAEPDLGTAALAARVAAAVRETRGVSAPIRIADRDTAIATALDRPTTGALAAALLGGALVSGLLAMLAVVISAVAASRARSRTAGILRLLGIGRRRLDALLLWELAPPVAAGLLGGVLAGISVPAIVVAVVDLAPATGAVSSVPLQIPVPFVLLAAVAVGAAAALAAALALLAARRLDPAASLKIGADT